ncbi:serine/threonine-protein kinase [Microbacterium testaceum]|uniref:serine/threonine-protein kinase n=1 Tax=Microbacterium testaceum TaxID=2033 RepID=UPI0017822455|nr:serine/threonine-protein kinase [Microbacterium testaceum]
MSRAPHEGVPLSQPAPQSHRPDGPIVLTDATALPSLGGAFSGRYRLIEPLGSDVEGTVYRARDDVLARDVAVKIFPLDPVEASRPRRRLAAARILTALDHPSLVTLYDAHLTHEGHGYLVMEFIPGPTLRQHLDAHGALAPDFAAGLLRDTADGLAAIHAVGIVHQHLESSNVLLRPERAASRPYTAVLADFGVTQVLGARPTSAQTHPDAEYLPPERLHGEPATPASDIYALGLLAEEMLTADGPLSGGAMQELVLAPLDYDPEVPKGFGYGWEVLLTAMTDPDPAARPTAAEVSDLARELEGRAAGAATESAEATPAVADAPELVTALRAVHQARATSVRRRSPLWAWVTHYR